VNTQYKELNKAWAEFVNRNIENSDHSWFVTFSFPFNIKRPVAEAKVNEWISRLRQTLCLNEDQMFATIVYAPQLREVLHVHTIIGAKGLAGLDRKRWEEKWTEITGRKKTDTSEIVLTHRHAGVIRRRDGEERVVRWVLDVETEAINSHTYYKGGGTCRIKPIAKDGTGYNLEAVARYIVKRHAREVSRDMQIIGARDF
jgi:hypothetical protein